MGMEACRDQPNNRPLSFTTITVIVGQWKEKYK